LKDRYNIFYALLPRCWAIKKHGVITTIGPLMLMIVEGGKPLLEFWI